MEEGRNEVIFDVTLESEWRWREEAFSPGEGIRQVMEEPREGAEEENRRGAGQHCLSPLPGLSPTHPRAPGSGLRASSSVLGQHPPVWGWQVQVSEPDLEEGAPSPTPGGPLPFFL